MSLKIVSWNIERGYQPEKIIKLLKSLKADIYCLQEVDRFVKRTGGVDVLKEIENGLGLHSFYIKEFDEIDSWQRKILLPIFGFGGGEQGNAIFTNLNVKQYTTIDLPLPDSSKHGYMATPLGIKVPFRGNRKTQILDLEYKKKIIRILNSHFDAFDAIPTERLHQLELNLAEIDFETPTILTGDLNTMGIFNFYETLFGQSQTHEITSFRKKLASKNLVDPFLDTDYTHQFLTKKHKLDWIAAANCFTIIDYEVIKTDLSDHDCLVVEFEFEDKI
jgi:endonuclease/exonuclease/phosphatase family metal-dependent hydrolase